MNNNETWNNWLSSKQLSKNQISKLNELFNFIDENFNELVLQIKWNQPMWILNNKFVIAFSPYKEHISFAPESEAIRKFSKELAINDYEITDNLFKIKYNQKINLNLISKIMHFQISKNENKNYFFNL